MAASASSSIHSPLCYPPSTFSRRFIPLPSFRPGCLRPISLVPTLTARFTSFNQIQARIAASSAPVMDPTDREAPPSVSTAVDVNLGNRSYPIYIGSGLLDAPDLLQRHVSGKRVLVVTNFTIAPLYLDRVVESLTDGNSNVSVDPT